MDLVYIPEVLTYGSFRSPQYRDYEQPWNKDYFSYGKSAQTYCQRLSQQQNYYQQQLLSKESCHLCRESKRRSLAAYIKGKSRKNSCKEIHEEEEENETACNERKTISTETNAYDNHTQKAGKEISLKCCDTLKK